MLRVTRQGPEALHFVRSPLEEGQEVQVKVDWERRFDHMQQHSGEKQPLYHPELRMHYYDTMTHLFLFFPLPLRSTFDHSFGGYFIWIQDHIMVHYYCTYFFPCSRRTCGLTFSTPTPQGTGASEKHH